MFCCISTEVDADVKTVQATATKDEFKPGKSASPINSLPPSNSEPRPTTARITNAAVLDKLTVGAFIDVRLKDTGRWIAARVTQFDGRRLRVAWVPYNRDYPEIKSTISDVIIPVASGVVRDEQSFDFDLQDPANSDRQFLADFRQLSSPNPTPRPDASNVSAHATSSAPGCAADWRLGEEVEAFVPQLRKWCVANVAQIVGTQLQLRLPQDVADDNGADEKRSNDGQSRSQCPPGSSSSSSSSGRLVWASLALGEVVKRRKAPPRFSLGLCVTDNGSTFDEDLLCPSCACVPLDPVSPATWSQAAADTKFCCGTVYCRGCLQDWAAKSATCPNCRERFTTVVASSFAMKKISGLKVRCLHSEYGCEFVSLVGLNGGTMMRHFYSCDYRPIRCHECGEQVSAKDYHGHWKMRCPKRLIACKYCGEFLAAEALRNHLATQPPLQCAGQTLCPNGCTTKITKINKIHTHASGNTTPVESGTVHGCDSKDRKDRNDETSAASSECPPPTARSEDPLVPSSARNELTVPPPSARTDSVHTSVSVAPFSHPPTPESKSRSVATIGPASANGPECKTGQGVTAPSTLARAQTLGLRAPPPKVDFTQPPRPPQAPRPTSPASQTETGETGEKKQVVRMALAHRLSLPAPPPKVDFTMSRRKSTTQAVRQQVYDIYADIDARQREEALRISANLLSMLGPPNPPSTLATRQITDHAAESKPKPKPVLTPSGVANNDTPNADASCVVRPDIDAPSMPSDGKSPRQASAANNSLEGGTTARSEIKIADQRDQRDQGDGSARSVSNLTDVFPSASGRGRREGALAEVGAPCPSEWGLVGLKLGLGLGWGLGSGRVRRAWSDGAEVRPLSASVNAFVTPSVAAKEPEPPVGTLIEMPTVVRRKDLNEHLRACPLATVKCRACGTNVLNRDLESHVASNALQHYKLLVAQIDRQ